MSTPGSEIAQAPDSVGSDFSDEQLIEQPAAISDDVTICAQVLFHTVPRLGRENIVARWGQFRQGFTDLDLEPGTRE